MKGKDMYVICDYKYDILMIFYNFIIMNLLQESQNENLVYSCSFQCFIRQANITMKFPCTYYIQWSTPNAKSLSKTQKYNPSQNVVIFEEKINLSTEMLYDSKKEQFIKRQTLVELFLISKSRPDQNKLVGRVTIDLSKIINFGMYAQPTQFRLNFCSIEGTIIMQFNPIEQILTKMTLQDLDRSSFIDYIAQNAIKSQNRNSLMGHSGLKLQESKSIDKVNREKNVPLSSFSPIAKITANKTDHINRSNIKQSSFLKQESFNEKRQSIPYQKYEQEKAKNKMNQGSEFTLNKNKAESSYIMYEQQMIIKQSQPKIQTKLMNKSSSNNVMVNNHSSNNLVQMVDKKPKERQEKVSSELFNQNYIMNRIRSFSNEVQQSELSSPNLQTNIKELFPSNNYQLEQSTNQYKKMLENSKEKEGQLLIQLKKFQHQIEEISNRQRLSAQQLRNKNQIINQLNNILKQKEEYINQLSSLITQKSQKNHKLESLLEAHRQQSKKIKDKQAEEETNLFSTRKYEDQMKTYTLINQQLQGKLNEEVHLRHQYEQKFNNMQSMILALERENYNMIEKYERLNELHKESKRQNQKIRQQLNNFTLEHQNLQNQYLLLQNKINQIPTKDEEFPPKQNTYANEDEINELKELVRFKNEELQLKNKEIDELVQKYLQLQSSNDQYKNLLEESKSKLFNTNTNDQSDGNNWSKMTEQNNQFRTKVQILSQTLKNYEIETNEIISKLQQDNKAMIDHLNQEKQQLNAEINNKNNQIRQLEVIKQRQNVIKESNNQQIEEKHKIILQYQEENLKLLNNQQLHLKNVSELKNNLQELLTAQEEQKRKYQLQQLQYNQVVSQLEEITSKYHSLEGKLSQKKKNINFDKKKQLQTLNNRISQKCNQYELVISRLNKDLQDQINQNNELSETIVGYMQKQAKLKETLGILEYQSKEIVTLVKQKETNEQTYKEIIQGLNYQIQELKHHILPSSHQFSHQNLSPIKYYKESPGHGGQSSKELQSQNNQLIQINEQLNDQLLKTTIQYNQSQNKLKEKISQLTQKIRQWQTTTKASDNNPLQQQIHQKKATSSNERQRQLQTILKAKEQQIYLIIEINRELQSDKNNMQKQLNNAKLQLLKNQQQKFGIQSDNHEQQIKIMQYEEELKRLSTLIMQIQNNLAMPRQNVDTKNSNVSNAVNANPRHVSHYSTESNNNKSQIVELFQALKQKLLERNISPQWQQLIQNSLNKSLINQEISKLLNLQQKSRLLSKELQKIKSHLLKSQWRNQQEKLTFMSLFKKSQLIVIELISSAQSLNLNQSSFL